MTRRVATKKTFLGALGPIRIVDCQDHWALYSGEDLLGTWSLHPAFQADFTDEAKKTIAKWLSLWGGVQIPAHGDIPAYVAKPDLMHLLMALAYA